MLNQERIKLMTRMASYESNQGRKNMSVGSYFRSDYIGIQVIKSLISATVAYLILFAGYIYYHFETLMQDIYKMDLLQFVKSAILYYAIFVGCYSAVSYVVYSFRYSRAKKSLRKYHYDLKQLSAMYDLENRR